MSELLHEPVKIWTEEMIYAPGEEYRPMPCRADKGTLRLLAAGIPTEFAYIEEYKQALLSDTLWMREHTYEEDEAPLRAKGVMKLLLKEEWSCPICNGRRTTLPQCTAQKPGFRAGATSPARAYGSGAPPSVRESS